MRQTSILSCSITLLLCGMLGACASGGNNSSAAPEPVAASVGNAASRPPLTGPTGCTQPISAYEALIDRDVTTGYLSQSVYDRINQELISGPRAACAAGRAAEANTQLAHVRNSHGYR
jgi:hypothetical protein